LIAAALLGGATAISGCASTIQDQPVSSSVLEQLVMIHEYPIYWLGVTFHGLAATNVLRDASGAFSVQYGDCVEGGQSTCVTPLSVVTSPDNGLHALDSAAHTTLEIRGVKGALARGAKAIEVATGGVVVDIYARGSTNVLAAARTMVPINRAGLPEAPLPSPFSDTGFASHPLKGQLPRMLEGPAQ
jgi:hypothetical protein